MGKKIKLLRQDNEGLQKVITQRCAKCREDSRREMNIFLQDDQG